MIEQRKRFDWFKLENYEHVKSFSLKDWQGVVSDRLTMSYLLTAPDSVFVNYSVQDLARRRQEIIEYWESIRANGVNKNMRKAAEETDSRQIEEFRNDYKSIVRRDRRNVGAIRDLTEHDVIIDILGRENIEEIAADFKLLQEVSIEWYFAYQEGDSSLLRIREKLWEKYNVPIAYQELGCIEVDLSASDEQLRDNFSSWLAIQRASEISRRPTRISQKDFDDWVEAKLLPYFDLVTLSNIDGVRISNHMLGDLLFPDELDVDVAERVRKVTKLKAKKVFSYETEDILSAQIKEIEKAEGKS